MYIEPSEPYLASIINMATATVERVTYREGNKYPQGMGGASNARKKGQLCMNLFYPAALLQLHHHGQGNSI